MRTTGTESATKPPAPFPATHYDLFHGIVGRFANGDASLHRVICLFVFPQSISLYLRSVALRALTPSEALDPRVSSSGKHDEFLVRLLLPRLPQTANFFTQRKQVSR